MNNSDEINNMENGPWFYRFPTDEVEAVSIPLEHRPILKEMLNHWFNPNKKEALIKTITLNKYHTEIIFKDFSFVLYTKEEDNMFIMDRLMSSLLYHNDLVYFFDDLNDKDAMMNLIKNKYSVSVLKYKIPEGMESASYAKKIVTVMANLKNQFFRLDVSEVSEEDKNILLHTFLSLDKDFYPQQVANTIKAVLAVMMESHIGIYDPVSDYSSENLLIENIPSFIIYDLSRDDGMLDSLYKFLTSLPVSFMMFYKGMTIEKLKSHSMDITEVNDFEKRDLRVPAIVEKVLACRPLVYALIDYHQSKMSGKLFYYVSENEDYIYQSRNLYRVLNDYGYFDDLVDQIKYPKEVQELIDNSRHEYDVWLSQKELEEKKLLDNDLEETVTE